MTKLYTVQWKIQWQNLLITLSGKLSDRSRTDSDKSIVASMKLSNYFNSNIWLTFNIMTQDIKNLAFGIHECLVKIKIINDDLNKLSNQNTE